MTEYSVRGAEYSAKYSVKIFGQIWCFGVWLKLVLTVLPVVRLRREWIKLQSSPNRVTRNRAEIIVMILLITYQLNILTNGHAPGIAMNWKSMWKYIKKQSILTKLNKDTLTPYWLKNRYKIGRKSGFLTLISHL